MNFVEAKEFLKNSYVKAGLLLVDEHERELFLKVSSDGRWHLHISEQEILEFADLMSKRQSYEKKPSESSICSNNYREQIVAPYDARRLYVPPERYYLLFGEKNTENVYVEIGPATTLFLNYFRFDEHYLPNSLERITHRPTWRRNEEPTELCDVLYRPMTIKVNNINAQNIEEAINRSTQIIDSCLFGASYLKNLTLKLEENWPFRNRSRVRPFRFEEPIRGNQLSLLQVSYNPDTLRFYQRGMGSYDPVDQFLSYYHVLEYYFVSVSDEQLYSKIARRINDPRFSTAPSYLDRIIQDTLNHKRETDEIEMLKLVLKKYVNEDEVIEFIKAYEDYLGEKIYSKRRTIFGESIEVKLEVDHLISNLAKRIKVIRNALVHSSDRYDRQQRYIPTTTSEAMISQEIPLMKYLAERVIIAKGS